MGFEFNSGFLLPVGGMVTIITLLIGVLAVAARSLRTTAQAIGQLAATNIALNSELQEAVKDRRASEVDREIMREQISTLATEKNLLTAEVSQVRRELENLRDDNKRAVDELGLELVKVKRELNEARQEALDMRQSITDLTKALGTSQERIKELEAREKALTLELAAANTQIANLQRDGMAKDNELRELKGRVTQLEAELDQSRKERQRLEDEKAELLKQLGLTADKTETSEEAKPADPEAGHESKEGI